MAFAPPSPVGAYIHVPFCRHRCGYCDFTLVAGRDELIDRYLATLPQELAATRQREGWPADEPLFVETIFLGGGTPTHPPAQRLEQLLAWATTEFVRSLPTGEFGVEANPLDLTEEKLRILAQTGVNRLSLGVQSFDANVLRFLERDHRPQDIAGIVQRAQAHIPNTSLDLIFGVPGQSLAGWLESLEQALALTPTHISTYGLTIEPRTSFGVRQRRGELTPVTEDLETECYLATIERLTAAGYEHYEVSNFAQPGFRSMHNSIYWNGGDYLGLGPGASSYLSRVRRSNRRSVQGWLAAFDRQENWVAEEERLDDLARAKEFLVFALRRLAGVGREEFAQHTGFSLDDVAGPAIDELVARDWLRHTDGGIALTRTGLLLADSVAVELL